jgi:broad specificity phosphatase PhoE
MLYLIRHGQPSKKKYSGFPGIGLGEQGKKEALEIFNILKEKKINKVFLSDYTRVIQTAEPFINATAHLPMTVKALRERENEIESHESLVNRVHRWCEENYKILVNNNVAIFGHCGSLNMVLSFLDPQKEFFHYSFTDSYLCHTPIGGIWEINLSTNKGELIFIPTPH